MKYLYLLFFVAVITLSLNGQDDSSDGYIYRNYDLEKQTHPAHDFSSTNPYQSPISRLEPRLEPITSARNVAQERIHNQCNALYRQQRFAYPTYSMPEMNARMCSGWSIADVARAVEYATYVGMQQGISRSDVEQRLLRQYEFYRIPAFRDYIKTFSGYRSHIKNLRDRLVAQKRKADRILRSLGLLNEQYVRMLDLAEQLYAENLQEEREEERIVQQQQRQREIQAQQGLLNKQTATHTTFEQQRESLQQLSDEWRQIQDVYQEHGLCDDGRYEQRQHTVAVVTKDGCNYQTKSYKLSPQAMQCIRETGTDVIEYQTCYGNQLQQVIHQECIHGIDRLASLPETSVVYPYKESLAHCFDAAREYNQAGAVDKATAVADFCWTLLDYGKAITEGALSGAIGAIEDMIEHPGQALLCSVAGEYVLAYQLSKILYNIADIGITYAFDAKRGKKQWDEYVAPVTQLIGAISNKELSLRDGLKGATQFAVQWKAQSKLLKGMNKFCKTAKTRAVEFAKNNPLASPEQYMVTPEGILLQSTNNTQPPASGARLIKYARSSKFFVANEQEITELVSKAQKSIQPTQVTLQTIGKSSFNAPEEFFKHIFTAELVEKRFFTGKIKKNLAGFHHYITGHLEQMGITLFNTRTCNKTGISISDVLCDGHLEPDKTFFPTAWSREKVISKMAEAVQNPTQAPLIECSRGVFFGKTSEGIIIKFVVDIPSGSYITAYPDAVANGL